MNQQTVLTVEIFCECGHVHYSIPLKSDTPICCPMCKTWFLFKNTNKREREVRFGEVWSVDKKV